MPERGSQAQTGCNVEGKQLFLGLFFGDQMTLISRGPRPQYDESLYYGTGLMSSMRSTRLALKRMKAVS